MYWWLWLTLLLLAVGITAAVTYRLAWWRIARRAYRRGQGEGYKQGYTDRMIDERRATKTEIQQQVDTFMSAWSVN